jgi:hypothetical protein
MENLRKISQVVEMGLVHPNAAGIDIGGSTHAVAVPSGRDTEVSGLLVLSLVTCKQSYYG